MNSDPRDEIRSILKEIRGVMFWLEVGWFWGLCLFAATIVSVIISLLLRIKVDVTFWLFLVLSALFSLTVFLLLKKWQKKCVKKN